MSSSANIRLAVPFFLVGNMETSLNFYVEKLGFEVTIEWKPLDKIEWCWLKRDEVSLMLQEPRDKQKFEYEGPKGRGLSICFQCLDALKLFKEFSERGVEINEPFVGNNMWVIAITDPDGYKLDFESPTNLAEETTYSEWIKQNNG